MLGVDLGTVSWKERTSHCDGPEKDRARLGGGGRGKEPQPWTDFLTQELGWEAVPDLRGCLLILLLRSTQ